jgi:hypothetical protein
MEHIFVVRIEPKHDVVAHVSVHPALEPATSKFHDLEQVAHEDDDDNDIALYQVPFGAELTGEAVGWIQLFRWSPYRQRRQQFSSIRNDH